MFRKLHSLSQPFVHPLRCNNQVATLQQLLSPLPSSRGVEFRSKHTIDRALVPVLNEDDLEEQFIKGTGPGGSKVNKKVNCCLLKHKPTGIVVKCHDSRVLYENRKLARGMLIEKLDVLINGDMSIRAQKERLLHKKFENARVKAAKHSELKKQYQELLEKESNEAT